jgi:HSP20 family protein
MEDNMDLRSLVPFRPRQTPTRTDVDPFNLLQTEIDRLLSNFSRGIIPFAPMRFQVPAELVPDIDVTEDDKQIVVTVELPGLERKDVDITIEDGVLTIRGEKKAEIDQGGQDGNTAKEGSDGSGGSNGQSRNYRVAERTYGVFVRMLQLPAGIDPDSVQAVMANGVLKIVIPKPAHSQTKKIEVKEEAKQDSKQAA